MARLVTAFVPKPKEAEETPEVTKEQQKPFGMQRATSGQKLEGLSVEGSDNPIKAATGGRQQRERRASTCS
eukprot:570490-Rhodomonas_salina.1